MNRDSMNYIEMIKARIPWMRVLNMIIHFTFP